MFYTFQDSKLPIEEHYSKKGVHPVEVYDILPRRDVEVPLRAGITSYGILLVS